MSNVKDKQGASSAAQEIKGLREQLEKNQKIEQGIEKEPRNVVFKSYLQGEPVDLSKITNTMFQSLLPHKQGEQTRKFAMTMMIEELFPKK
jgi:hypothetical protein